MTRIVWCLVGLLCLTGAVSAMGSTHYGLDWNVIGGGGGAAGSAHYALDSTIGQIPGQGAGTSYKLTGGFWSNLLTSPVSSGSKIGAFRPSKQRFYLDASGDGKWGAGDSAVCIWASGRSPGCR